jgi:hypothetical protein
MISDLNIFAERARLQAVGGDLGGALAGVAELVLQVIGSDLSTARVFSSRDLDALCLDLGRLTPVALEPAPSDPDRCVFLVTGVFPTGGHSRVLLDLIRADASRNATVLVTNTYQGLRLEAVAELLTPAGVEFELAPDLDFAARLAWAQGRLAALRPARTYILQHHFDPLCVAAVQPELVDQLFYFHNGDHNLTLGVHIPHAVHVDFNAKSFYHCREAEGVVANVVWPLTVDDPGCVADHFHLEDGLTTCCCGGFEKFELPHLVEVAAYAIRYEELVTTILSETGGRHLHIGQLSDRLIAAIRAALRRAGLQESRFIHLPFTPELTKALIEAEVDVFVGSAPRGGGRAMVEAMAVGLPMLVHSNYRTIFFSAENDVYEGAMVWRTLADVSRQLGELDVPSLRRHAAQSRAFYEANHHPDVLKTAMSATIANGQSAIPPRPRHQSNALQAYLDERQVRASAVLVAGATSAPPSNMPLLAQKVWDIPTSQLAWALGWRLSNKVRQIAGDMARRGLQSEGAQRDG